MADLIILLLVSAAVLGSVFVRQPFRAKDTLSRLGVTVAIHPSGGSDEAIVVQIDTDEELEGEGMNGPKIRVLINDDEAWAGIPYEPLDEGLEDDLRIIRKYNTN